MDQKKARKLEQELVCHLGLRRLPLLPSHKTMQEMEMARAAIAVYEAEVDRPKEQSPSETGE